MLGEIISGIIGAGASLIGGSQNRAAQEKANAANLAWSREQQARNEALQKEFAQTGIRWKVDDAKSAGIHPLYALGAQTTSFAPSVVGADQQPASMGDSIASAGQSIGRAVEAGMTRQERAVSGAQTALSLEKAQLENDLLRTEIDSKRRAMIGPAMPALGDPGVVEGTNVPLPRPRPLGSAKTAFEYGPLSMKHYPNPGELSQDDLEKDLGEPADMYGVLKVLRNFDLAIRSWDERRRGGRFLSGRNPFSRSYERR